MISYNWEHQDTALKIRDELKKSGYKVWIDVEKMRKSFVVADSPFYCFEINVNQHTNQNEG